MGSIRFDVTSIQFITDYKGEILIYYNGEWGGFCYETFTKMAGIVICRQLGFHRYVWHSCCAGGKNSFAKIWVTRVRCSGHEKNITECNIIRGQNTAMCSGAAILTCESKFTANTW